MSKVTFALRAEYKHVLCGVLAVGDSSIDVQAELKAGNGHIEVPETDQKVLTVLDGYKPLERVKAASKPKSTKKSSKEEVADAA